MSSPAPALVGREPELGTIAEVLSAPDRLPAVVLLYGEAGIGKTSVWLASIDAAAARGFRILSSRPAEAETGLSYAGLTDLVGDAVVEVLPRLPPIQRRALEAALLLGESESGADERAVAAGFLESLRLLSSDAPICLAVDDVQWLDAASVATLRFGLSRLRDEPVALLVASRGEGPPWLRRALDERVVTVEVPALSIGATRELLVTRLAASFPRPTLVTLWKTSVGNPLFALELGRALQGRGGTLALGEGLPIPAALDELLQNRLEDLGSSALEVTRAVAFLADPTVALVEAAVGPTADAGLTEALAARIVELDGERVRLTHPLLGTAVTARQTPSRRRSLHARLATIVPTSEERAWHLALATIEPRHEIASTVEEASRAAHARGAPAAAAELAEQALRLTPGAALEAATRLLAAARLHHQAGDSVRALGLLEQARAEGPPGPARAAVLLQLSELRYDLAGPREPLELLDEALAEAGSDDALLAEIHHAAAMCVHLTGPVAEGLEHAAAAVRALPGTVDAAAASRTLATYGLLCFDAGRRVPHAEMSRALDLERSQPRPRHLLASQVHAHHLSWSGEIERARETYLEILAEWAEADLPDQADPLFQLAVLEWRAGSWEASARYAEQALEIMRQSGRDEMAPILELPRTTVAAHRGNVEEARAGSERGLATTPGNLAAQAWYSHVLGFIALSQAEPAMALAHLRRSANLRDELGVAEPGMRLELGDLLEALIATGELDEAEKVLATWEPRADALDRAWALATLARCRALHLAARGDLDGAFALFDCALAEHARTVDPFQHARTLLALGRTQRRAKQRAAARATLEDALTRFETLGAPLWAEQTRAELARIGGRAPSRGELTEAESRIAKLVAEGRTNREVAAALFLTEHSVETSLTRVYRKLGVRSRGELAHLHAASD